MNKNFLYSIGNLVSVALLLLIAAPTTQAATQFSTGRSHSCAVTEAGGARCWGFNSTGQLGTGNTAQASSAVDVSGLTSAVTAVTTGNQHSCALVNGGVKCWGFNFKGQLGDGTNTQRLTPVDVTGLTSGIASISAGLEFTCAVTTAGAVKCWGNNGSGQLGTGTTTNSNVPVDVSGLTTGVANISAGGNDNTFSHSCAVITSGTVKCWGINGSGQLGNGTTTPSLTAVDVSGISSGASLIDIGADHSCTL